MRAIWIAIGYCEPNTLPIPVQEFTEDQAQPVPAMPIADLAGAYASDDKRTVLTWAANYPSATEAEQAAVESCERAGGRGCESFGAFGNLCGTYARNSNGKVFGGFDIVARTAARKAMRACNDGTPEGICLLWKAPICAGGIYPNVLNDTAERTSPADLEKMSAEFDDHDYWGVVLATDTGVVNISTRVNFASRKEAEKQARADCPGCKLKVAYRNSCVGIAWPSRDQPVVETYLDRDPARAEAGARRQCDGKHGKCVVALQCSGRRALNVNGGVPTWVPKKQPDGTWVDTRD